MMKQKSHLKHTGRPLRTGDLGEMDIFNDCVSVFNKQIIYFVELFL